MCMVLALSGITKSLKAQTVFVHDIWTCFHAVGCVVNGMTEEFISLQTFSTNRNVLTIIVNARHQN